MVTPMEFAASIAGIGDVSFKILRLLHSVYDDTHGIRSFLKHWNQSIESLRTVLGDLGRQAADPNLSSEQRQLLQFASTTANKCTQLLDQLQTEVPFLKDDAGPARRAYAAIIKTLNSASIKEKKELINMHMQSLNVSLWIIQQCDTLVLSTDAPELLTCIPSLSSKAAPENVARVLGQLNSPNTTPADVDGFDNVDEYSENERKLVEAYHEDLEEHSDNNFLSGVRAGLLDALRQEVDELAVRERFLQAAEKIKTTIGSQRSLATRQDNNSEEIKTLEERRADLLLQCSTVRCHREAFNILQHLVSEASTDREKAILNWKIGRLFAVPEFLGDGDKRSLGLKHLNTAVSLLLKLEPFPHDIFCSATQLIAQVFKESGNLPMSIATLQEMRNVMEARGPPNWQEASEVRKSAALDWCGTKGYPVNSDRFRYTDPVKDVSIEGTVKGRTPLHIAAREGEEQVVKEMLAEVDENAVDIRDSSCSTPLMEGAKACHIATVETLLKYGANADNADAEGRTALHWAADQDWLAEDGPAVVKALLAQGTPGLIDRRDDARGETALHLACLRYHSATVDCLLAYDADPNLTNQQGQSPLLKAISESDSQMAGHQAIARDIVHALLDAGANPNIRDIYGNTALFIVCLRKDVDAVGLLLDHGSPSLLPRPSISSIATSVTSASAPTISTATTVRPLILTDVNQRGKRGETPLIVAVNNLHKDIVQKLRKHGANPAEADQRNQTAWDHAKRVGTLAELRGLPDVKSQPRASISESRRPGSRLRRWLTLSDTS